MKAREAVLRRVRIDEDMVAVPLSESELEVLAGMWEHSDELDHESLSIQLKAVGGLRILMLAREGT